MLCILFGYLVRRSINTKNRFYGTLKGGFEFVLKFHFVSEWQWNIFVLSAKNKIRNEITSS